MAKSNFINKKFFVTTICLLAVIALGIGLYFLFRPKVDLKAPYNDFYSLTTSSDYTFVTEKNEVICNYIDAKLKDNLDEQTIATFKSLNFVTKVLNDQNTLLLDNLLFANDHDGKMLKLQQTTRKNFETLTKDITECKQYLETYLDTDINYTSLEQVAQKVVNYKTFYVKFMQSLTAFYSNLDEIFENYLYNTIDVNEFTKYNTKTITSWSSALLNNITDNKDLKISDLETSCNNLSHFNETIKNLSIDYYYENFNTFSVRFENFNNVNFNDCIKNLANNTYESYVEKLEGDAKTSAQVLGESYFMVLV